MPFVSPALNSGHKVLDGPPVGLVVDAHRCDKDYTTPMTNISISFDEGQLLFGCLGLDRSRPTGLLLLGLLGSRNLGIDVPTDNAVELAVLLALCHGV